MTATRLFGVKTIFLGVALAAASGVQAENNFTLGIWGNYRYLPGDEASQNSWGQIRDEAVILYASGQADAGEGRWLYASELRLGPGSFTDPANNSTDNQIALHQAWVGWQLNESHVIKVGKSQVPFGWKTVNFWPGDILLAGYGDQMDVGVKLSGSQQRWQYDAAFYLADDWGADSTDTLDDNAHWGSSTGYRKVQTWVGNLNYQLSPGHKLGVSLQAGGLQDLTGLGANEVDGDHSALALYYLGEYQDFYGKASYTAMTRDLPERYSNREQLVGEIENQRLAAELGYNLGPWSFYIDLSSAEPDTQGIPSERVYAVAPGVRYDYGPGWLYIEYLNQTGGVDRNGQIAEGDFDALYITLDFYL